MITFQIIGLTRLIADFQRAENLAKDASVPLSKAVDAYYRQVSMRFYEGQYVWQPLSEMRVDERGGSDRPVLIWTGDLEESATGAVSAGGSASATTGQGIWGGKQIQKTAANMWLAGYKIIHQDGMVGPRGVIPARPFWMFDDREVDIMFEPVLAAWDEWIDNP